MKDFMLQILGGLILFLCGIYENLDDAPDEEEEFDYKIFGVVDGPYDRKDFPEEELLDTDIPDTATTMLVVKIQESDGSIGTVNMWFDTFNEAYDIKNHFLYSIDPIVVKQN